MGSALFENILINKDSKWFQLRVSPLKLQYCRSDWVKATMKCLFSQCGKLLSNFSGLSLVCDIMQTGQTPPSRNFLFKRETSLTENYLLPCTEFPSSLTASLKKEFAL